MGGVPDAATEYVLFTYAPTASGPVNPAWTIDTASAPNWDASQASVFIDAAEDRVLLTGQEALTAPLDADFNEDGAVDGDDFLVWQRGFNQSVGNAQRQDGDANGDGYVNGDDFLIWRQEFGSQVGAGSSVASTTPEPSSGCVLAICVVIALAWRRQRNVLSIR